MLAALVLFFTIATPLALAQSLSSAVPDPVQFLIAPETPGPNQLVEIEAQGVGTFLGDATVTWKLNNKTMQTGVGSRIFSFTTGALGQPSVVDVTIDSAVQGIISREFTFLPSAVNLIWEADTTVPPFYRGKALYSAGSDVKVVAFPTVILSGGRVPASQLSFQWTENGTAVPDQSGTGQTVFQATGSQFQTGENISVDVYLGATRVGTASITIPASDPQLVLYVDDPLRGVLYDSALQNGVVLSVPEFTVDAVPYFFSNASKNAGLLQYAWTINGADTTGPDSQNGILTLRQTGSSAGLAALGVSLQNTDPNSLVQNAATQLQIAFGSSGTNILSALGL
jgi:hypothetical protein